MPQLTDEHVLCAYVNGSNLADVAQLLRSRFRKFIDGHAWTAKQVVFVDRKEDGDPGAGFLPAWDLGINLGLDHAKIKKTWFADVQRLMAFLQDSYKDTGKDFVVYLVYKSRPWLQEHLWFVDDKPLDFAWLQAAIERLMKLE